MANTHYSKIIFATALALTTTFVSIAQTVPPPPAPPVAPKPPAKIESFEAAQKALQRAQAEMEKNIKDLKIAVPPLPQMAEMEAMIGQLKQAAEAKVEAAELSEVKRAEIQKELATALQNAQEAVANLKINKALQGQQEALQQKVQQEMKKAHEHMAAAAEEMRQFEVFVNTLAADGLIQKEAYNIEEKEGKLLIDGKEQPAAVYEKHRSFLNQHKGVKITKDRNGLQIQKN